MPILDEVGININHPAEPGSNDIIEEKRQWSGWVALIANGHTPLLAYGSQTEIEAVVKKYCMELAPGGGYVLGSSTSIMEGLPPKNTG